MITAVFKPDSDYTTQDGLWQYDYGQTLRIHGLDLPQAVEIHFSLQKTGGESIPRIGITKDGVTDVPIPDSVLENEEQTHDYNIYVFIYLSDGKSGKTTKWIKLSVTSRPKPEPFEKPEEAELFREAIVAVNESAERAEAAEKSAEAWNHGHVDYPERDNDNAMYYAKEAEKSAEHAEQAARESGYIQFLIIDGRLIEIRTENVNVNFELREGRLVINA